MKRSKFTEEQIIAILREQEAAAKTAEVCHSHGISGATFMPFGLYRSRSFSHAGPSVPDSLRSALTASRKVIPRATCDFAAETIARAIHMR